MAKTEYNNSSDPLLSVGALSHVLIFLDTQIITKRATFRITLREVHGTNPPQGLQ
jgi:hypothetical protein